MLIDYQKVSIYQADKCVLKDVNFHVDEGEFTYLIGKVGSGKSSLLKTLYCELDLVGRDRESRDSWTRPQGYQAQGNSCVTQRAWHHFPRLPVAPRPHRAQKLRVCAQGYWLEKERRHQQAHRGSAQRGRHDRENRQDASRVVWRRAAAHSHRSCPTQQSKGDHRR